MGSGSVRGNIQIEEPSATERSIVRRAAEARATVPDLELEAEVEMTACLTLAGERECSITAILVRAFALALREVPRANASYRDGVFELHSRINVGVVISAEEAYLIPTVFDADLKGAEEITSELRDLVDGARTGRLSSPAFSGATFTLANVGACAVGSSSIMVSPPQAAAASAGAIRNVPVVREADIVPGHLMSVTLACDHRILHGSHATSFLTLVHQRLERAEL